MKPNQTISSLETLRLAPPRSSWPPLGTEGLRRSEGGVLITGKLDRPGRRASSGAAPAAQPPPAMGLEVFLFGLVPGQRTLAWVPLSGREAARARGTSRAGPRPSCGGADSLWVGESGGTCQGVGSSSCSFLREDRFSHQLPRRRGGGKGGAENLSASPFLSSPSLQALFLTGLPLQP